MFESVKIGDKIETTHKRYFKKFNNDGDIVCFEYGATSWSTEGNEAIWDNWELSKGE